ncbi:helix-turn-helix domain-containing protein [Paenibacillus thalictri]|uniref:AraC family transcriptional regulator n=1 Tax=Paenibacillus thalictri TaxID=2527873 RepID=A0A4Q9DNS5_9BACL|nr:helix-turn-helix domain-containing protein [Paenibacillus thalictri]TBL75702.1 AraC family transcriptional regulator [Paenibacillus thalictri]
MRGWKSLARTPVISWMQRRFYRKSLLIVLLVTCVPTLLVGIGVNWIGISQLEKNVSAAREAQVKVSIERTDELFTHLEKNATQWAFNPVLGPKLLNLATYYDYEHIREIIKTLILLKGSSPLVEEAYLYLDTPGSIFSEEGGVTPVGDPQEKRRFHALLEEPQTTYWLSSFGLMQPGTGDAPPALIYRLPAGSVQSSAALIVYLNKSKMAQMLGEPPSGVKSSSFLITSEGSWIVTAEDHKPTVWEEDLRQAVLAKGKREGTFIYSWKGRGEQYSVSYSTSKRLGQSWTYVSYVSLSEMAAPVLLVSRFIYAISLGGLLTGIVISVLASRKLYEPIRYLTGLFRMNRRMNALEDVDNEVEFIEREWKQLTEKSRSLQERVQEQLPRLREGFLMQLLQGHFYSWTEDEVRQRMRQLEWVLEDDRFAVVIVQLHGFSKLTGRFLQSDTQLVSYATANIIEESAKSRFAKTEVINFQDMSAGLLILFPEDRPTEQIKLELYEYAEHLTTVLNDIIKMGVTVCLGRLTSYATQIPVALEEARRTVKNRKLAESNQILDADDYAGQYQAPVQYPYAAESDMIQAIRTGQLEDALAALRQFFRELNDHMGIQLLFTQGMFQLLGNVQFGFLKAGYDPYKYNAAADLHAELARLSEPEEAVSWFERKVVRPYVEEVQQIIDSQDQKYKIIVDKMIATLHEDYHTDISLEACASEHGVNPFSLSRIFKQLTGVNFIEYLTQVRLDHSKRLLAETDAKINEIAERVGYQPTYFNRIFKKYEGVTPSRYRELHIK